MIPWPQELQPTSAPTYDAGVTELAWRVLQLQATDQDPTKDTALVAHLAGVLGIAEPEKATEILARWAARDAPRRGLRLRYPFRSPPRLRDAEVHLFLQGALENTDRGTRLAWQMLFRSGFTAEDAWTVLAGWRLSDGVLPTGQWFSAEDLNTAAPPDQKSQAIYRFSNGAVLPWAVLLDKANLAASGRKINAIKDIKTETGCGLKEAYHLVNDLLAGRVTPNGGALAIAGLDARDDHRSPARIRLDACIDGLLRDRPMHWVILATAEIREDPGHPTMAVGVSELGQLYLFYSPTFVRRISRAQCKGVLLHEINHVLLGHLRPPEDIEDAAAWRCACECSANEFIPYPLPGNPVTLAAMGLPPMESTLARYEALKGRDDLPGGCSGILLGRLSADPSDHTAQGNQPPPHPLHVLMEAAELVGREIDRETLELLRSSSIKAAGSMLVHLEPEGLGSLPWEALLRKKADALSRRRATRRFPSRRFPDRIGIVPGRRRHREAPTVLAAVDTSGSMTTEELIAIVAELRGLTRRKTRVALVQCDTTIHEARWLSEGFTKMAVKGRGGTDLCPPFAPPILRRFRPGLLVYFTDGYGPAPPSPPPGVEVLWILTGASPRIPARYGQVVCMRSREARSRVKPPP